MIFHRRAVRAGCCAFALSLLAGEVGVFGQGTSGSGVVLDAKATASHNSMGVPESAPPVVSPLLARYFDPVQGSSSIDLVRRALTTNGELLAARLDIERARARLRQAGLRPNPTIDFEQQTGRFTGAAGESETSIGLSVPLELGGKRQRRIDLAQAELQAAEAEIAERERKLTAEVRAMCSTRTQFQSASARTNIKKCAARFEFTSPSLVDWHRTLTNSGAFSSRFVAS